MNKKVARELIQESWELRKKKRYREAEVKLLEALEISPGDQRAEALLAEVFLLQKNLPEARKTALKVLEKNPAQLNALTALGVTALEEGALEEAIENLQKAYELGPNPYRAGRLARAYEMHNEKEKALQVLQQALEETPHDNYLLKQYSTLRKNVQQSGSAPLKDLNSEIPAEEETSLAYAEKMRNKLASLPQEKAAAQLQKMIKVGKRSQNPHLYNLLGDLWREAEKDEEAAAAYQNARQLDPQDPYPLAQEAFCYRRLGKKLDAWPLLKQQLYQNPQHKAAKASFLKDAEELQKQEEAIEFLEELLQNHPQHKELYGSIKKLSKQIQGEQRDVD